MPKVNQRAAAPVAARRPGTRRDVLPDAGRRDSLRRPAGRDRRGRHPRAGPVRRDAGPGQLRREAASVTTIDQGRDDAYEPERIFGGADAGARPSAGTSSDGLAAADVRIDAAFRFAANHHNPIEALTTTAAWDGDQLTLYDSCQGIKAVQLTVAALLGLSPSKIRVLTRFVGGAFGMQGHGLAARDPRRAGRPARPAARSGSRCRAAQMFTSCGHREEQEQHIELGRDQRRQADRDPAPQDLGHLPVRRLGRARLRRRLAALCLPQLSRACTGWSAATR